MPQIIITLPDVVVPLIAHWLYSPVTVEEPPQAPAPRDMHIPTHARSRTHSRRVAHSSSRLPNTQSNTTTNTNESLDQNHLHHTNNNSGRRRYINTNLLTSLRRRRALRRSHYRHSSHSQNTEDNDTNDNTNATSTDTDINEDEEYYDYADEGRDGEESESENLSSTTGETEDRGYEGRTIHRRHRQQEGREGESGEDGGVSSNNNDGNNNGNNDNDNNDNNDNNDSTINSAEGDEGAREGTFIGNGWWFLVMLLIVQLYQSGGFIFFCMLTLYIGFNSSAMLTYRSKSWKFRLAFLVATTTVLFIYWKFNEERLWMYLLLVPYRIQFSITTALWTVWVNEFIVVFYTIILKHYLIISCASFRIVGQSTKKKLLVLIEQTSKLYRCLIPTPVWILYLHNAFVEEDGDVVKIRGLFFSCVYFVIVNIRFIGKELSKIINHKTPEELCRKATHEDIAKYAEDCAICREDLNSRSPLALPCNHVFCSECIYQWFDKHPSCPTCRTKVGAEDVFEEPSGNTNIHLQENGIGLSISFEDL